MEPDNIRILRFIDGSIIVCMCEEADIKENNFIKILYPIELFMDGDLEETIMREQYMLKPWIPLSDDVLYEVSVSSISVMSALKEEYLAGYERVVNRVYFREDVTQESQDDEFTPEDLLELIQAKEEGKLN
jgi:hypothetical protein